MPKADTMTNNPTIPDNVDTKTGEVLPVIPEGFRTVSMGELPPNIDFDKRPIVQGVILQKKECVLGEGKRRNETEYMVLKTATDKVTVWRSAALVDLFEVAKIDDEVFIQYIGKVKTKSSLNDMKQFVTGHNPHPDNNGKG